MSLNDPETGALLNHLAFHDGDTLSLEAGSHLEYLIEPIGTIDPATITEASVWLMDESLLKRAATVGHLAEAITVDGDGRWRVKIDGPVAVALSALARINLRIAGLTMQPGGSTTLVRCWAAGCCG